MAVLTNFWQIMVYNKGKPFQKCFFNGIVFLLLFWLFWHQNEEDVLKNKENMTLQNLLVLRKQQFEKSTF